jgi:sugar phosphate isomerase/epimerase
MCRQLNAQRITINQISTNPLTLSESVDAYARAGVLGITPWQDKVEAIGASKARRTIRDAGLSVTGFCFCGLFTKRPIEERGQSIADAKHSIDVAIEVGAPSIVTLAGGLLPGSKSVSESRAYAFDCLLEIAEYAKTCGIRLALESLHPMYTADWSVINVLRDAVDWAAQLGDAVGVAVDTYHTWYDSSVFDEIRRAGLLGKLYAFHISDWLVPTSDLLLDRGLPGEGVIDLKAFRSAMDEAGFDGWVEVELFSTRLWASPQAELVGHIFETAQQNA